MEGLFYIMPREEDGFVNREKAFFVEWFTVGCQIYMSREDAGGVVSRKEKKIASAKRYGVKERLQMKKKSVQIFTVMSCDSAALANRN